MFEFTADAGVSPKPSTAARADGSARRHVPRESSFLIDLPFTTPPQPAVLSVPRHGATRVLRKRRAGSSSRSRVPQLVWDGNYFPVQHAAAAAQRWRGEFFTVSAAPSAATAPSAARCSGSAAAAAPAAVHAVRRQTHPVKVRSWKSEVRRQKTSDFQTSDL